jgi:hypothetical protein
LPTPGILDGISKMPFLASAARRSLAVALAHGAPAQAPPREALAYCRSTTCQDSQGECPRDDDGCKTTGHPLFWKSHCVGFSIQKDGTANLPFDRVAPVIEGAFLAWTDLPCDGGNATIAFSRLDDVSCHRAEYDSGGPNANIVLFQDDKWTYKASGDPYDVDNTLAKTTVTFDPDTGEILDADIELNYAYNELTVGDDEVVYDLQSVLTHEIGHFIGLDHSSDVDATMNASYAEGDTSLRTLEADDIAAACAAYPADRPGTCSTTPRGGFADTCTTDSSGGGCSTSGARLGAAGDDRTGFALLWSVALVAVVRGAKRRRASAVEEIA